MLARTRKKRLQTRDLTTTLPHVTRPGTHPYCALPCPGSLVDQERDPCLLCSRMSQSEFLQPAKQISGKEHFPALVEDRK